MAYASSSSRLALRRALPIRQPLRPVVALQRRALQRRLVVALPAVAPCCQPPSCGLRPDLIASCPPSRPAHPSTVAPGRRPAAPCPAAPSGHRPASRRALLPAVALPSRRSSVWSSPCLRLTVAPCPSVASCPAVAPCHRVTSRRALSSRPSSCRVQPPCPSLRSCIAYRRQRLQHVSCSAYRSQRLLYEALAVNVALLLRALPASLRPASFSAPCFSCFSAPSFSASTSPAPSQLLRALLQLLCFSAPCFSAPWQLLRALPALSYALPSALQTHRRPAWCGERGRQRPAAEADADALPLLLVPLFGHSCLACRRCLAGCYSPHGRADHLVVIL